MMLKAGGGGGGGDTIPDPMSPTVGIHTRRGAAAAAVVLAAAVSPTATALSESQTTASEARPTRQWDAWTREEEESFFGALRQVGKNFEKITSRVRSKNKDQVRHYYYRVIKRINRVLAPTLILDAKNSTYVNTAMLRWWALLEKQNCTASKLRLKPRRLKTFVTALEHQLVKDHKNSKKSATKATTASRRSASQAEKAAAAPPAASLAESVSSGSGESHTSGADVQARKGGGTGKGTALKRKAAGNGPQKPANRTEANHSSRSKKSTVGTLSKAAHARWVKAACVGVSLIAEAADQLERTGMAGCIVPASDPPERRGTGSMADCILPASNPTELHGTGSVVGGIVAASEPSELQGTGSMADCISPASKPSEPRGTGSMAECILPASNPSEVQGTGSMAESITHTSSSSELHGTGSTRVDHTKADVPTFESTTEALPAVAVKDVAVKETTSKPHPAETQGLGFLMSSGPYEASRIPHLGISPNGTLSSPSSGTATVANAENGAHEHVNVPRSSAPVQVTALASDAPRNDSNNHSSSNNPSNHLEVPTTDMAVSKLKLRLFPLDDHIRKSLEQDGHNPHLELTCKSRKSISSVLDHLVRKWGRSAVASGDLRLFPFSAQWSTVLACQNWSSQDMNVTAGDVHASLGNPTVFRLRYAWLSARVLEPSSAALESGVHAMAPPALYGAAPHPTLESEYLLMGKPIATTERPTLNTGVCRMKEAAHPVSNVVSSINADADNSSRADRSRADCESRYAAQEAGCAWLAESNDGFARQLWSKDDALSNSANNLAMSQMDWLDSRAAVSISELMGDGPHALLSVPIDFSHPGSGQAQWSYPESFDVSLARGESPSRGQPLPAIWAGEETCDGFSFQRPDRYNKETIDPWSKETTGGQLGVDVGLADFRSINCWREGEGEALAAFDVGEHCNDADLLLDEDASTGLGGIIDALALDNLEYDLRASSLDAYDTDGVVGHSSEPSPKPGGENTAPHPGAPNQD